MIKEIVFEENKYRVCLECSGLGVYPKKDGAIWQEETKPFCLDQWQCRKARNCRWSVLTWGREVVEPDFQI